MGQYLKDVDPMDKDAFNAFHLTSALSVLLNKPKEEIMRDYLTKK